MVNSFAIATLIFSFMGIIVLLFRRVPELVKVDSEKEEYAVSEIKKEKSLSRKKAFNDFLKKTLIKFKIFTQKTENKTSSMIKKIEKNHEEEKNYSDEDYWNKLKK